MLTAAPFRRNG